MGTSSTLDELISSANEEKVEKKPLLNFSENIAEIREICQMAAPYVKQMNPLLMEPDEWELIARAVIEMLKETFIVLRDNRSPEFSEVFINYGSLMKIAVTHAVTKTGEKCGTFNPCIYVGEDLKYETSPEKYNDLMTSEMSKTLEEEGLEYLHPMFYEQRKQIAEICSRAARTIMDECSIEMYDSESLTYMFVAFFRKAKEWLIAHEEDEPVFYIGRLIKMGLETHKDGSHFIFVTPAQEFKMEYAKMDGGKGGTER